MKNYVLDANALIRLYRDAPGADIIQKLVLQAKEGRAHLSISVVNLTEVYYILNRFLGQDIARKCIENGRRAIESIPVNEEDAIKTAVVRTRHKLGLADCFAAELAMRIGATLVTADPEFAKLGKRLKVLALPRHAK